MTIMERRVAVCLQAKCIRRVLRAAVGASVRIEDRSRDPQYRCECTRPAAWCLVVEREVAR